MIADAKAEAMFSKHKPLNEHVQHFVFYLRKQGVAGCLRIAWRRFWTRHVGQREWLYSADLINLSLPEQKETELVLVPYRSEAQARSELLSSLSKYKSQKAASSFLSTWFARGATLWTSKIGDDLIGLQWTLEGGIDGFYSLPIQPREVIIVAVEVFLPFKGRGLYPRMLSQLLVRLKETGHPRAYLKVANSNRPMQRSMSKTKCQRMGRVYTRKLFGRWMTLWDKA